MNPRVTRWLWESRVPAARLTRALLTPAAALYAGMMRLRAAAYRRGWLATRRLPVPAIAVGNLTVGGAGKTPIAAWIAGYCAARGRRPGILLRGYGGDERLVHERLTPGAVVVADPNRVAGGGRAVASGADLVVLDDAFQRLDIARDLNVVLIAAESLRIAPWPLPAGPWRERWAALGRAQLVVITRKRALPADSRELGRLIAEHWPELPVARALLRIGRLEGLLSGTAVPLGALARRRVVAAAGVADPVSFAMQLRAHGATVQLMAYQDHHPYGPADLDRLLRAAGDVDYLIVTEKDAVKLRHWWPRDAREPLVAVLTVEWEEQGTAMEKALDAVLALPVSRGATLDGESR